MHRVIATLLTAALVVAGAAAPVAAQSAKAAHSAALKWGPAPAVFPRGAKMAVVSGDPSASAPFVVRLSFPAGYRVPPHFHPTDENVTVRSGNLVAGMGDTIVMAKGMRAGPGVSKTFPANMHHWVVARSAAVVQVSAMGPFQLTYVNAADDPQHSAASK